MDGLIQIVILICLFLIIVLLAIDKVKIVKREKLQEFHNASSKAPEIMGKVLTMEKDNGQDKTPNNRNFVFHKEALLPTEMVSEVLIEMLPDANESNIDFDDEDLYDDDRFGQGVSLNELIKVGNLLQHNSVDELQEKETVEVMLKMQGTEIFDMMQRSIEGSAQKIAILLDKSLAQNINIDKVENPGNDIDSFDIGNFI